MVMIICQALYLVFEGVDAGRSHKTSLPHATAKYLAYAPGPFNKFGWAFLITRYRGIPQLY